MRSGFHQDGLCLVFCVQGLCSGAGYKHVATCFCLLTLTLTLCGTVLHSSAAKHDWLCVFTYCSLYALFCVTMACLPYHILPFVLLPVLASVWQYQTFALKHCNLCWLVQHDHLSTNNFLVSHRLSALLPKCNECTLGDLLWFSTFESVVNTNFLALDNRLWSPVI